MPGQRNWQKGYMRFDPDIILQACIFEWVTQKIETVRIPEFVFRDFGMEPEDRCFCLADTLFPGGTWGIRKPQRGTGKGMGESLI